MAQDRRSSVLKDFLDGKHSVVVSTGLLARGLDLLHVQQVGKAFSSAVVMDPLPFMM